MANANQAASPGYLPSAWSTLFAQEPEQDLEFDEGLEDDELNQHKPPTRRPLLWILLLLIAVGVMYWTMKPDLAQFPGIPGSSETIGASPSSPPESGISDQATATQTIPIPKFGEGDTVTLSLGSGNSRMSMTLTADAAGRQPGPRVKTGESLIVIDGQAIDNQWMYEINTSSGKRGWISEKHLQRKI